MSTPTKCEIWALFNSADKYKKFMDPKLKAAYKSLPPLQFICMVFIEYGLEYVFLAFTL